GGGREPGGEPVCVGDADELVVIGSLVVVSVPDACSVMVMGGVSGGVDTLVGGGCPCPGPACEVDSTSIAPSTTVPAMSAVPASTIPTSHRWRITRLRSAGCARPGRPPATCD